MERRTLTEHNVYTEVCDMSKVCASCGKGKMSGNLVSHSNRKTPRTYSANLKKVKVEINGKESTEYVCTRCIRTANKAD